MLRARFDAKAKNVLCDDVLHEVDFIKEKSKLKGCKAVEQRMEESIFIRVGRCRSVSCDCMARQIFDMRRFFLI